jgi:hypothetical protein
MLFERTMMELIKRVGVDISVDDGQSPLEFAYKRSGLKLVTWAWMTNDGLFSDPHQLYTIDISHYFKLRKNE